MTRAGASRRGRGPIITPSIPVGVMVVILCRRRGGLGMLEFGALSYAYRRIGISAGWMLVVLAAACSAAGSTCRSPCCQHEWSSWRCRARAFGMLYRVPARIREGATVVAINVGGALVPLTVTGYLVAHDRLGSGR